jgi:hypothetical protein
MDFWESRGRVIAMIVSLRAYAPTSFAAASSDARVDNAWIDISGEPMNEL